MWFTIYLSYQFKTLRISRRKTYCTQIARELSRGHESHLVGVVVSEAYSLVRVIVFAEAPGLAI